MTGRLTSLLPPATLFNVSTLSKRVGTGPHAVQPLLPGERAYIHKLTDPAGPTYCFTARDGGNVAAVHQLNGTTWQALPNSAGSDRPQVQCSPQFRYAMVWAPASGAPGSLPPVPVHPIGETDLYASSPSPSDAHESRLVVPFQLDEPILSPPILTTTTHQALPRDSIVYGRVWDTTGPAAGSSTWRGVVGNGGHLRELALFPNRTPQTTPLNASEGTHIKLIWVLPSDDFNGEPAAMALLTASTVAQWHASGVRATAAWYPIEHIASPDEAHTPVGNAVVFIRALPPVDAQGNRPAIDAPIFALQTDAAGTVLPAHTSVLSYSLTGQSVRGGSAQFRSQGTNTLILRPWDGVNGDRTLRAIPLREYKAMSIPLSAIATLARDVSLLTQMDPGDNQAHIVAPLFEDAPLTRFRVGASASRGGIQFPTDPLPLAADGHTAAYPGVSAAFTKLNALLAAINSQTRASQQAVPYQAARVVTDYFTPTDWRDSHGQLLEGDAAVALSLTAADFENLPGQDAVDRVDRSVMSAAARVDSAAADLASYLGQAATLHSFLAFITDGGLGHAQWVSRFFGQASDKLGHGRNPDQRGFRAGMLAGLLGGPNVPSTNAFVAIGDAIRRAGAEPETPAAAAHAEPGATATPDTAEAPEDPLEKVKWGLEQAVGVIEWWTEMQKVRLEQLEHAAEHAREHLIEHRAELLAHTSGSVQDQMVEGLVREIELYIPNVARNSFVPGNSYLEEMQRFAASLPAGSDARAMVESNIHHVSGWYTEGQNTRRLELSHQRREAWAQRAELLGATLDSLSNAIEVFNLVSAVYDLSIARSTPARMQATQDFANALSGLIDTGSKMGQATLARHYQQTQQLTEQAAADAAEREFTLGPVFSRATTVLALAALGCSAWKLFHSYERSDSAHDQTSAELDALGAVLQVAAVAAPPPIDAIAAAAAAVVEVVTLVFDPLWDFYYDPVRTRMEVLKRKAALSTIHARRPIYYLPSVQVQDRKIIAQGVAPFSAQLVRKIQQRAGLVLRAIVARCFEWQDSAGTTHHLNLALGSRARLPNYDARSETAPAREAMFSAIALTPRLDQGRMSIDLPADMIPIPHWGGDRYTLAQFQHECTVLEERSALREVRVQIFASENISSFSDDLWAHTIGTDHNIEVVGVSVPYAVTFANGVATDFTHSGE